MKSGIMLMAKAFEKTALQKYAAGSA